MCRKTEFFVDAGWKWNMENGKSKEGGGERVVNHERGVLLQLRIEEEEKSLRPRILRGNPDNR
jgi:hypothetical protein